VNDEAGSTPVPGVADVYMATEDNHWYTPTAMSRGPWDPNACHAGPPTGVLVRTMERALRQQAIDGQSPTAHRLVRITVGLSKPIPMAGFYAEAEFTKVGRAVSWLEARLRDSDGKLLISAAGMAIRSAAPQPLPTVAAREPRFQESTPGAFPLRRLRHDLPGFWSSTSLRYPPGETPDEGPTTVWMKTVPLLAGEAPSPFQRVCPLADSGNAFSRNAPPSEVSFINPDLTIVLHREPEGEWIGSSSRSFWQPDGIGLAEATLYDSHGEIGTALQTLLLDPSSASQTTRDPSQTE